VVIPSIRPRRNNQEEDTVALTTDDQALTTAAEAPAAPAPETPRPSPRRVAALAWVGAGLGVAAVVALSIAALRDDDPPATTDDNARTVIEHGSIAALDHRLDVVQAQRTPAETVAEHGSVAAADEAVEVDATTSRTIAEHANDQDPAFREQMVLAEQSRAQR
jgi:hypothetical protein